MPSNNLGAGRFEILGHHAEVPRCRRRRSGGMAQSFLHADVRCRVLTRRIDGKEQSLQFFPAPACRCELPGEAPELDRGDPGDEKTNRH